MNLATRSNPLELTAFFDWLICPWQERVHQITAPRGSESLWRDIWCELLPLVFLISPSIRGLCVQHAWRPSSAIDTAGINHQSQTNTKSANKLHKTLVSLLVGFYLLRRQQPAGSPASPADMIWNGNIYHLRNMTDSCIGRSTPPRHDNIIFWHD